MEKRFENVADSILDRNTATDPETETGTEQGTGGSDNVIKSQRLTFVCTPEVFNDLSDLALARAVRGVKVENAIAGRRARKPSASLILVEAITDYLNREDVKQELAEYRKYSKQFQ